MFMHSNQSVTLEEIKKIVTWTRENISRYEIAKRLGRSTNTIWRYQKKYLG